MADGPGKVRSIEAVVTAEAAACEQARTLTPRVVDAMWDSGLFRYMNPAEAGGDEPGFRDMIETWIAMAGLDGSFGWTGLANFSSTAASAAYLPDPGLRGGVWPRGRARDDRRPVCTEWPGRDRRRRLSGFPVRGASDRAPGTRRSSQPDSSRSGRRAPVGGTGCSRPARGDRAARGRHLHRWLAVQGLKGTGSYDYHARDLFVPAHRTFRLFANEPLRGSAPTFRMGLMPITAAGHASWALGVAKSMLDDVQQIAASKVRMGDLATLAHRPQFQQGLAHHVAMWRAARLLVLDAFEDAERAVAEGRALAPRTRADLRVAAVYATDAARARRVGPPRGRHHRDPRRQPARARIPRPLHRHPARVHQREGGRRGCAGLARPGGRSPAPLSRCPLGYPGGRSIT